MSSIEKALTYHLASKEIYSVKFDGFSITIIFKDGEDLTVTGNSYGDINATLDGVDLFDLRVPMNHDE
jgi:hypothetical protein